MTEFVTTSDGTRIAFEREGAGPVLLLLHSLPGSRRYWRQSGYFDALAPHFTVAAMDTRGFGESDAPTVPTAYAEQRILEDVMAVADALGAQHTILWGHSYGATIARQLAATSDRVTRVVMAGTAFGPIFTEADATGAAARLEPIAQAQESADPEAALAALGVSPEERARALAFPARSTLLTIRSMTTWRPTQPSDLRSPALVVTGTRDTQALAALDEQREAIAAAGIEVVTLPNLDHGQLVTECAVVLSAVLPFLLA